MSLKTEYSSQEFLLSAVGKEPIVPDLLKAFRKHMLQEATDKFLMCQGDGAGFHRPVISGTEGNGILGHFFYPGIRDGDAVCVSPEIINGITKPVEGLLYIRTPVFTIQGIPETIPCIRGRKILTGDGQDNSPGTIQGLQCMKELAAEQLSQNFHRDKETGRTAFQLQGICQARAGYDAVDMRMIIQLLSPGMKNLDDSRHSPEIFPVPR